MGKKKKRVGSTYRFVKDHKTQFIDRVHFDSTYGVWLPTWWLGSHCGGTGRLDPSLFKVPARSLEDAYCLSRGLGLCLVSLFLWWVKLPLFIKREKSRGDGDEVVSGWGLHTHVKSRFENDLRWHLWLGREEMRAELEKATWPGLESVWRAD